MKKQTLQMALLVFFFAVSAQAATFTVNSTNDGTDANTADNICETAAAGECTLRAAIEQANITAGADAINFNIAGAGVHTITPLSALPNITQTVTIDGYTQPGASPNTLAVGNDAVLLIEINGGSQNADLFHFFDSNNVIRGLVINSAPFDGIFLGNPNGIPTSGNVVEGNFIGTDPTGTIARGNGRFGVSLYFFPSANNLIGGTTPAARNIISGNGHGVVIGSVGSTNNVVRGNYIGTTVSGTTALGNSGYGVGIGTGATGNRILSNAIFSNGALGIDLGGTGVTPNDAGDPDAGENNFQNFPVIASAVTSGGGTMIQGTLNSTANTGGFVVEFFASPSCDSSGYGEGQRFLGSITVNTDNFGNAFINQTLASATFAGEALTATATDPTGNTSEFSQCLTIMGTPQTFTVLNTADAGAGSLRQAILDANANNFAADTIAFNIAGAGVHTISPLSALPDITETVVIDGYTQPGSSVNTLVTADNAVIKIELDGSSAGAGADGLRIVGSGSIVRGLAVNRFTRNGITLVGASGMGDNITISGSFIGTDAAGAIDLGNGNDGIGTENGFGSGSDNNLIGGISPAARNIISGNGGDGVEFFFCGGNTVQGNFIGLAADGSTAIGNSGAGVSVSAFTGGTVIGGDDAADGATDGIVAARNYISGNAGGGIGAGGAAFGGVTITGNYIGTDATGTLARGNNGGIGTNLAYNSIIGGSTAGAGNLISGNTNDGINIGNTGDLIVRGNRIGTTADGISPLGNTGDGVEIYAGGSNNRIGGIGVGEGNVIAFNTLNGVQITDVGITPTGNPILSNSIFSNGGLAINLSIDGVTPNDAGDADAGANNFQNFPVVTSALPGSTRIVGTFNSTPGAMFRLEFFNSLAADASGNGEGQLFIGSINVTTDASGNAAFDQTFAPNSPVGSFVSATATNLTTNDTSEFSNAKQVLNPSAASVSVGGRVLNSEGQGIFGAQVSMTDASGSLRQARTNPFGYYRFDNVSAGETYIFTINHKRFEFAPQIVFVTEDRSDFDFTPSSKSPSESGFER
jgi:CSLREA domain-containing protein